MNDQHSKISADYLKGFHAEKRFTQSFKFFDYDVKNFLEKVDFFKHDAEHAYMMLLHYIDCYPNNQKHLKNILTDVAKTGFIPIGEVHTMYNPDVTERIALENLFNTTYDVILEKIDAFFKCANQSQCKIIPDKAMPVHVNMLVTDKQWLLILAIQRRWSCMAWALILDGANINTRDKLGRTPLMLALASESYRINFQWHETVDHDRDSFNALILYLLHDGDFTARDVNDHTALFYIGSDPLDDVIMLVISEKMKLHPDTCYDYTDVTPLIHWINSTQRQLNVDKPIPYKRYIFDSLRILLNLTTIGMPILLHHLSSFLNMLYTVILSYALEDDEKNICLLILITLEDLHATFMDASLRQTMRRIGKVCHNVSDCPEIYRYFHTKFTELNHNISESHLYRRT
jgi:hypothetical protein